LFGLSVMHGLLGLSAWLGLSVMHGLLGLSA
jgi:hypothetical protein